MMITTRIVTDQLTPEAPAPLDGISDVQVWLSQIAAIFRLALPDIEGASPGVIALGAAEILIEHSMERLSIVETSMLKSGRMYACAGA